MVSWRSLSVILLAFLMAGCTSNAPNDEEPEAPDESAEEVAVPDYSGLDAVRPFNAPIGTDSQAQTVETNILFNGGTLEYELHVTRGSMIDFTVTEPAACAGTVDNPTFVGNGDAWIPITCADSLPHGPVRVVVQMGGLVDGYLVFHDAALPSS